MPITAARTCTCVSKQRPPLCAGRAWLLFQRVQEEGDGFVHLVHADPAQHLLQERQSERMVVSAPAVAPHWHATWWKKRGGAATEERDITVCMGGAHSKH